VDRHGPDRHHALVVTDTGGPGMPVIDVNGQFAT